MNKVSIFGGVAAIAVVIAIVLALTSIPEAKDKPISIFPIKVDFARIIQYKNFTDNFEGTGGYIMHIRLLYPEEGAPRPFYLLLSPQRNVWDQVADPEQWVKVGEYGNHGFEVLSSSKEFDLFTEYFPFDWKIIPLEMRLYCPDCEEKWSEPYIIWQGFDTTVTKMKGLIVHAGESYYEVGFALGNDQIDTLPASGTAEFQITDSIGVILYESIFKVEKSDFIGMDEDILYLGVPLGGKASYVFTVATDKIKESPTGKTTGFAFLNFMMEDGRILSGGTRDVQLSIKQQTSGIVGRP